mgnify:CR=1 FL=1
MNRVTSNTPAWRKPLAGMVLLAVALIALPFVLASAGTAWVRITNLAILFTLLALGLNIVVGFAGLLDLGYIAFYGVGAYAYALLASPQFGPHCHCRRVSCSPASSGPGRRQPRSAWHLRYFIAQFFSWRTT